MATVWSLTAEQEKIIQDLSIMNIHGFEFESRQLITRTTDAGEILVIRDTLKALLELSERQRATLPAPHSIDQYRFIDEQPDAGTVLLGVNDQGVYRPLDVLGDHKEAVIASFDALNGYIQVIPQLIHELEFDIRFGPNSATPNREIALLRNFVPHPQMDLMADVLMAKRGVIDLQPLSKTNAARILNTLGKRMRLVVNKDLAISYKWGDGKESPWFGLSGKGRNLVANIAESTTASSSDVEQWLKAVEALDHESR